MKEILIINGSGGVGKDTFVGCLSLSLRDFLQTNVAIHRFYPFRLKSSLRLSIR